ncbi:MAG: sigma-54-dependent Fis family transcriptional regulator [Gammaproteobacteria bacterium]|nr:sigma-54-dependent Fis family transcriptional regulator [Gammaproteobacteria bacterium]
MSEKNASIPSKILILDENLDRSAALATVLTFLDYEPKVISDATLVKNMALGEDYLAVFVAYDEFSLQELEPVSADKNCPPFILLAEEGEMERRREKLGKRYLTQAKHGLKYEALNDLMHRAELFCRKEQQPLDDEKRSKERSLELFRSMVGNSRGIVAVRKMIEQVADTEATVMILGASGTGKEVAARNIHYISSRRNGPFVPINCGAIPAELLESELFGHEKGAFTGAISTRQGRFEMAEGGTLFLDEIGDMPLNMQVKLLRVLQERCFERVGSNKSIKTNVRIVTATHRNLSELIAAGNFREDLYYRLNVFPIDMPSLAERIDDLPLLIQELIARMEHEFHNSVRLTPAAVTALCHYSWPGNVRELANLMERMAILHPYGVVDVRDLPEKYVPDDLDIKSLQILPDIQPALHMAEQVVVESQAVRLPSSGMDLKKYMAKIEVDLIQQALEDSMGVVAHAAKLLTVRRTTLVERMRKYGISRREEAS